MACPADAASGSATIHALGSDKDAKGITFDSVELVGSSEKLTWKQEPDALNVKLPASAPCSYAYVLKLSAKM